MKNIIIILLSSHFMNSQPNYPAVSIWRVTPDTLCQGDTLKIDFKVSPPPYNSPNTTCFISIAQPLLLVWSASYFYLDTLPKEHYYPLGLGDSTYFIKVKIPINYPPGLITVIGNGISANNKFTVKDCNPTTTPTETTTVGIQEYEPQSQEPIYFNLQGERIQKRTGELIIQQTGNTRKKMIIW